MVIDIELTLNRWGWKREGNKMQVGCFRIAVWHGLGKAALCVEINWKHRPANDQAQFRA